MGRSTRIQAARNREHVVEVAAALLQRRGIAGLGIAELMAEAGLTHGAFYRQFPSKDEVAGEACARSMEHVAERWRAVPDAAPDLGSDAAAGPEDAGGRDRQGAIAARYLAGDMAAHRCPMPALAAEVAREPAGAPVRAAFTRGVRELAGILAADPPGDRARALGILGAMVGAVALARAVDDPALAEEIIAAARQAVADLAAAPASKVPASAKAPPSAPDARAPGRPAVP